MNLFGPIEFMDLASPALLGILLWLVFLALRRFVPLVIHVRTDITHYGLWVLRAEVLSWAVLMLWLLYRLMLSSPGFTMILLLLALLPAWPFWRDFFPGLLFRTEGVADPGDQLIIDGQTCTVESLDARYARFKTSDGNVLIIPYHQLDRLTFSQTIRKGKTNDYSFTVVLPGLDKQDATETLRRYIREAPWSIAAKPPRILFEGGDTYRVTISAINDEVAGRLRKYLRERIARLQG